MLRSVRIISIAFGTTLGQVALDGAENERVLKI